MAFLSAKQWQFGRQNVFATDVGAVDLPSTNTSGVIQVGDWCLNLAGTVGNPAYWVCSAQSTTSVTWQSGPSLGSGNDIRTSAVSTTLLSTDHYLFMTAAGTVTLPAPNTTLGTHEYTVKAFGATAQPVTIVAASGGNLDSVTLGTQTLSANEAANYFTDGVTNWLSTVRDGYQQSVTPSLPYTVSVQDKYIVSVAGSVVMPAGSLCPTGYEYVIHCTTSSTTITAAAGTLNGASAITLAANAVSRLFTTGTNWFTAN